MHVRHPEKRGMILLVILCMLAMFGLIGIAFIMLAGNARRSAVSQAKVDQVDNPFSLAELEPLLRPFDIDASMLPSRLTSLLRHTDDPSGKMSKEELAATGLDRQEMQALRHKVTTESWSLPCPAATL